MRRAIALVAALGLFAGGGAEAACPDNWFTIEDVGYLVATPTATVTYDQNGPTTIPWEAGQACPGMCYDLPHGRLEVTGYNYLYGHETASVRVSDEYVVSGPAGPPLAFEAVLVLDAEILVEGHASASFAVEGFGEKGMTRTATGQELASIPVSIAPGTNFRIDASVYAEGGHYEGSGHSKATIRFRGLSPQYVVTSCQGYDLETPALRSSWGGVKALYR